MVLISKIRLSSPLEFVNFSLPTWFAQKKMALINSVCLYLSWEIPLTTWPIFLTVSRIPSNMMDRPFSSAEPNLSMCQMTRYQRSRNSSLAHSLRTSTLDIGLFLRNLKNFDKVRLYATALVDTSYRTDRRPNSRGQVFRVIVNAYYY